MPITSTAVLVKREKEGSACFRGVYLYFLIFSLSLLIMITFYYLKNFEGENYAVLTNVTTHNDDPKEVELPDGSLVILDAGSSIKFPEVFQESRRDVFVEGSVLLKVKPGKILNIHSANSRVRLIKGEVMITAYPETDYIIVAAFSENIELIPDELQPQKKTNLKVGKQVVKQQGVDRLRSFDSQLLESEFLANSMNFSNTPLEIVLAKIWRKFNSKIELLPKAIGHCKITGDFRGMTKIDIVKLLCIMLSLDFENQHDLILLRGQAC